ncbi:MAG: hypothetical protein ACOYKZ_05945 [Chlamydiia bacterium]
MAYSIRTATAAQLTPAEVNSLGNFLLDAANSHKTDSEIKNAYDQASSALDKLKYHRGHFSAENVPVWNGLKDLGGRTGQDAARIVTAARTWIQEFRTWAKPLIDQHRTRYLPDQPWRIYLLARATVVAPEPAEGSTIRKVARAVGPYFFRSSSAIDILGKALTVVAVWMGTGLIAKAAILAAAGLTAVLVAHSRLNVLHPRHVLSALQVIACLAIGTKLALAAAAVIGGRYLLDAGFRAASNFRTIERPSTTCLQQTLGFIGSSNNIEVTLPGAAMRRAANDA